MIATLLIIAAVVPAGLSYVVIRVGAKAEHAQRSGTSTSRRRSGPSTGSNRHRFEREARR